jgi:hypothetical protein
VNAAWPTGTVHAAPGFAEVLERRRPPEALAANFVEAVQVRGGGDDKPACSKG